MNCEGQIGGLAIFWSKDVNVEIVSYSKNHIDAWITNLKLHSRCHLIAVYGHPESSTKKEYLAID